MQIRMNRIALGAVATLALGGYDRADAQSPDAGPDVRLAHLQAEVVHAEDVSAIKRLQRTYGYYLDKGMWSDLAEFFALAVGPLAFWAVVKGL